MAHATSTPWTIANVTAVSAPLTSTVPSTSGRRASVRGATSGTSRTTPTNASGPTIRFTPNAQRQSARSAITAPSSGPAAQAAANVAPYSAKAVPRAWAYAALIVPSAAVIAAPPPIPWTTRAPYSTRSLGARAASALPARNTARPPRYARRGPIRSATSPAAITTAAAASENSALTYCRPEKPRDRSRAICGSTRLTIDMSTTISATPSDSSNSPSISGRSSFVEVVVTRGLLSDRNIRFRYVLASRPSAHQADAYDPHRRGLTRVRGSDPLTSYGTDPSDPVRW